MRVIRHPEVPQELEAAALWYEERQPGLGEDFLGEYQGYQKGGVGVDSHSRRSLSTARVSISGAPLQIRSSSVWMSSAVKVRFLRRRTTNGSFPSSIWTDSPGRRCEAKAGFRTSSRLVIVFMLTNMSDACLSFKPLPPQIAATRTLITDHSHWATHLKLIVVFSTMTTAVIENNPDLLNRVTELQGRIFAVQEELQAILRGTGGLQVILPELHDETTGRIDTQKVAH